MKKFCALFVLVIIFLSVQGQPEPAKYGKIDIADLEMKVYDRDTSASAVILCDYGKFTRANLAFTRLLRIKILKKEGYDVLRSFNISGLEFIKGCTYNLENGVIVESKLKNESIYKEQIYDDNYRYRITMPDMKVGSVIEIQYSFPLLPAEWRFQDIIPVRWSELRIEESTDITYQKVYYGFEPLYISENGRWVGRYMPALRQEPYLTSIYNYITKIEFELSSITIPGYMRFYTTSWDAVNKYLVNNSNFGTAFQTVLFLGDEVRALKSSNLKGVDLMKKACDMIKSKMKWNETESLYTSGDLSSSYKKGSGNSADINLTLVALLKKFDFEVYPLALSTRSNGIISPTFPTIDKFNYVIAVVKYENKYYFFDATDSYLPSGMLPFRALNGQGRIINATNSEWVELNPNCEQRETVSCNLELNETGELTGNITYIDTDYEAYYDRINYKGYNSHDEYIKEMESNNPGMTINSSEFQNADSVYKPVNIKLDVSLSGYTDMLGDMISLRPMHIESMESNPFKMEKRKYPINYGHNIKSKYILNVKMPEGYEIAEMPKPCNIVLPDKSGRFTYAASVNGNIIQLVSNFEINKITFVESEYDILKEFYNQVIAKHAEVMMLKKKI